MAIGRNVRALDVVLEPVLEIVDETIVDTCATLELGELGRGHSDQVSMDLLVRIRDADLFEGWRGSEMTSLHSTLHAYTCKHIMHHHDHHSVITCIINLTPTLTFSSSAK